MAHYYFSIIVYLFLLTGSIISEDVSSSKSKNFAEYSCPVRGVYRDYSLRWTIENYNYLSGSLEVLKSPEFPPEGPDSRDWHIEFLPSKIMEDSKYIFKLSFVSKSSKKMLSIPSLTISTDSGKFKELKPNNNNLEHSLNVSTLYSALDWDWSYDRKLIISTTIRVLSSTINSCSTPSDRNNWLQDISQFWSNDKTLRDFTITVQGKEFRAHKDILAARSPVFSRMFSEDREQGINRTSMEINDLSSETVGNILTYIYTDNVDDQVLEKLSSEFQAELLGAARLYDLEKLAAICMRFMHKNPTHLKVDNVLEALEAADKYSILNLKKSALIFIVSHRQLLRDNGKLKSLTAERPHLMVELSRVQDNVRATPEDLGNSDVFETSVRSVVGNH